MKKLLFILALAFTLQASAQGQANWITDYKDALQQSLVQNKPVLAFVTDNQKTEASERLNDLFFSTDVFEKLKSKVILLKLDISDKNSNNARLGIHYTKQVTVPGLALVDKYGNTIVEPLTEITDENFKLFFTSLHDKLKN